MPKSTFTKDELVQVLDYSCETGLFHWRVDRKGAKRGDQAGCNYSAGYMRVKVFGHIYIAHRLAWFYVHGRWPTGDIDHINGIRSDNRIANLRDVSRRTNCENLLRSKNNKAAPLGVTLHRKTGRWQAQIKSRGISYHLGLHDDPNDAHAAYVQAKRKLHIGCTI